MKLIKFAVILLSLLKAVTLFSQENTNLPERTPEQEAVKQTEKMQQELKLTPEQARQIHEINLRYARARKVSNTRSEAIQRIKNKEADIAKILNEIQRSILNNKRYERSSFQLNENRQNLNQRPPVDAQENQTGRQSNESQNSRSESQPPAYRTNPSENNLRSNYRTTPPNAGSYRQGTTNGGRDTQRSTYNGATESRSSVRSASGTESSSRTSSNGSGRSSSSTQQPSNSGRR